MIEGLDDPKPCTSVLLILQAVNRLLWSIILLPASMLFLRCAPQSGHLHVSVTRLNTGVYSRPLLNNHHVHRLS